MGGARTGGSSLQERKEVIRRFGERVGRALQDRPPTKELVRNALRRKGAPRCIVRIQRLSLDVILRYGDGLADVFSAYPDDIISPHPYDMFVGYQPPGKHDRIDEVKVMTEGARWTDEWGTEWGHAEGGVGATSLSCPLAELSRAKEYLAHRFPDARAPGRLDAAAAAIRVHGARRYCMGVNTLSIFERLHALRGLEDTLMDLCTGEPLVLELLDRLVDYHRELIRSWGGIGADGFFLGDDWGSQRSMIVSADLWRRIYRPRYRTLFDEIHRAGMDVIYHSCGNIMDIIPDLIDIGVDVLDPVQPGAMDPREIARRFGGRIVSTAGSTSRSSPAARPAR